MTKKKLPFLPDEVISNIVRRMDDLSSVFFALTSHKNYDIVQDVKRRPLKALCPPFRGSMYALMAGDSEHERLICQLWWWLGERCVFCWIPARYRVVQSYQGRIRNISTIMHYCWGWLSQSTEAKTWIQRCEFLADMTEFKERLCGKYKMLHGSNASTDDKDGCQNSIE